LSYNCLAGARRPFANHQPWFTARASTPKRQNTIEKPLLRRKQGVLDDARRSVRRAGRHAIQSFSRILGDLIRRGACLCLCEHVLVEVPDSSKKGINRVRSCTMLYKMYERSKCPVEPWYSGKYCTNVG
jgi:hypothetical protein